MICTSKVCRGLSWPVMTCCEVHCKIARVGRKFSGDFHFFLNDPCDLLLNLAISSSR